jgi:hypothetical protein
MNESFSSPFILNKAIKQRKLLVTACIKHLYRIKLLGIEIAEDKMLTNSTVHT